jgi:hypothetical protein
MAATPLASNDSATALSDAACLKGHRQGEDQGDTVSCGDGTKTATQLGGELVKLSAGHKGNRHDTPNKLPLGAMCCTSEDDFSPASTFGTTLSGGESAPNTPRFEQFSSEGMRRLSAPGVLYFGPTSFTEPNFSFTTSTDETDNVAPDDKHQSKFIGRLVTSRSATETQGNGVPLSQSKSDSCPDRLPSMIHDLELHDRSGEDTRQHGVPFQL